MTINPDHLKSPVQVLKTDLFGQISKQTRLIDGEATSVIVRNIQCARWWTKPVARYLAAREARVLAQLPSRPGLPCLIHWDGNNLCRSFIDGEPMQSIKPRDGAYFKSAKRLLHCLHRAGVVHNDSAKEPNWLVLPDGSAGLVDYQLSAAFSHRTKLFRVLAFEDIRHLLKHKRSYRPTHLSSRELRILANPAWHSRLWKHSGKKVYMFITRRVFKWQDREGANDRNL